MHKETHLKAKQSVSPINGALENDDSEWYKQVYFPAHVHRFRWMIQAFLENRVIVESRGPVILDIGCGTGTISAACSKLGCRVFAIDYHTTLPKEVRQRYGISFIKVNLDEAKFPFKDQTFACIFLGEVIEHLRYRPLEVLHEIYRCLSLYGILILTTPNVTSITEAVKLVRGHSIYWNFDDFVQNCSKNGEHDMHHREYSPEEIHKLLSMSGFQNVSIRFMLLEPLANTNPLEARGKRLLSKYFSCLSGNRLLGSTMLVIAKRFI